MSQQQSLGSLVGRRLIAVEPTGPLPGREFTLVFDGGSRLVVSWNQCEAHVALDGLPLVEGDHDI